MSKTPNYDLKVKAVLDAAKLGERVCALTGEKWMMTEEEIGWYKKFNVPPSELSPNTRWKWAGYFDIGFQFWWNKHARTGEPILSFHHPASGIRVLPDAEWYEQDFSNTHETLDLSKPFFEQLRALELRVPFFATANIVPPENSLALLSFGDQNSYFVFACQSKRTFFGVGAMDTEDSSVVYLSSGVKESHHISHSHRMYRCRYARESQDCLESAFLFDCRNCEHCFGATNKRNRKFLFMNEQLSEGEYRARIAAIDLGKRSIVDEWSKRFDELLLTHAFWPENFNVGGTDATGDYLHNATRCHFCFDSEDTAVDNFRSAWLYGASQGNAYAWGAVNTNESYSVETCPDSNRLKFCYRSVRCEDSEYCMVCRDCRNCFGCVGLAHKEFHILNKPYTEEEYWKTVDAMECAMMDEGTYGSIFPTTFSSSYIPESGSVLYAGSTEEDLRILGGNQFLPTDAGATGVDRYDMSKTRQLADIPDNIDDLTDAWIGVPIYDEQAKRAFSFLKPEVEHYRKWRIAPPGEHFIPRMQQMSWSAQIAQFENRVCTKCSKPLLVTVCRRYPNRRILCRDCYLAYLEKNG
ncbi:hypothetical protein HYW18_03940 [Candidatus Uhrbacteria bacterium]|nr:hypothetical protein [Candidatus Uhrbacteria bacterium]